jgi:D-alanyl-D-alanine carboxypeptidase
MHILPATGSSIVDKEVLSRAIDFISPWLQYRYEQLEMPGFVVAIAHDGKIEFNQAYGYANLEHKTRMTVDHIFRIASHSKTFAATAIMQLAEDKLLSIDDPVVKHVSWLNDHADARMKQITIRQLLSHSAGIIRDGSDSNYWQVSCSFPNQEQFKKQFMASSLIVDNNSLMKYSNFGYTLIGCVIENVSGNSFNQYVQDRILSPLNLDNTGPEFKEEILSKLATGYSCRIIDKQRIPISKQIDTQAMSSATGFYSTAADMCKYFAAQFIGTGKLLSDESKKEMQRMQWRVNNTKENEEYGLGFGIDYCGDRRLVGHGGGFPGHITRTFFDSQAKLVVVVLTNCINGEAKTMGKGIVSVINHFEESNKNMDKSSIERLQKFTGRFMELWGDLAIVENGNKFLAIGTNNWFPFNEDQRIGELDYFDDSTLKITRAHGFYSQGESVIYNRNGDESIQSIRYAGCDMLPEAQYKAHLIKSQNYVVQTR